MNGEVNIVTVSLPTALADGNLLYLLKAPSAGNGGGLTLLAALGLDSVATGQGAGTAYALQLLKYSGAGTPMVNGTISTANIGGTASPFAAGVPQAFGLSPTYSFVPAGEWVVLKYTEEGAATNPVAATITLQYIMGK